MTITHISHQHEAENVMGKDPSVGTDIEKNDTAVTVEQIALAGEQVQAHSYEVDPFAVQNAVKDGDDYVEFRTMGWLKAGLVSTAESIALGLLSFPSVYYRLGMGGGLIATILLGTLAYVTAWQMVNFKLKHMGVMNFADAGGVMWGRTGSIILGTGMILKCMGLAGSHVLVGQTALRTIGYARPICQVWYGLLVTIVSIMMSWSRQWGHLWWMSFVSLAALLAAALITIVATGIQSPEVLIKHDIPIEWLWFPNNPSLMSVVGGITNIIFAYGGNMGVFSFCSEMPRPNDFKKSFIMVQLSGVLSYTIVGATIYAFGGQYVTSPALTMTSTPVRTTAYSIAMITIMVSGILAVNIGAKYLYVATLRKSELLTSKSMKAQSVWLGLVAGIWVAGFLVAQLIPFFNSLLTVISSLFSVWFSFGFAGIMWLHSEHPWFGSGRSMSSSKWFMFAASVLTIVLSLGITPLGLYSAAMSIKSGYSSGSFPHPFNC